MSFNLNTFKASLAYGGARNNLFDVKITNPVEPVADLDYPLKVRTAQIPTETIEQVEVPYFGRTLKFAGRRTYEDWTVTVINDEDFIIRNALETWLNAINTREGNLRLIGPTANLYKSNAEVTQYGQDGRILRVYKLIGVFPTTIGEIGLDWEGEEVEVFDVTFAYDYHIVDGTQTGDGGGL